MGASRRGVGAIIGISSPPGDRETLTGAYTMRAEVSAVDDRGAHARPVPDPVLRGGEQFLVLPPQWGDGGHQVIVAGYHRGTHGRRGLARMVMPRRHLTGAASAPCTFTMRAGDDA